MKINKQLINELINKEYRDAFVSAHIDNGIPFQIRALRKRKGWTQKELAEHVGMKQERISALENPNYSKFTLSTLKKLASAFDVALIVRFAPFGELAKWELELSPESLTPPSFEEDPYFKPPVTEFVAQGGFVLSGEGVFDVIYPSQPSQNFPLPLGHHVSKDNQPAQPKPQDELAKYRKAKQKGQSINKSLELMAGKEEVNETALG